MKKINILILLILLSSTVVFGQLNSSNVNIFSNFTAIINKGEVNLNWRIMNPVNIYKFKIESKKAGTENYNFLSDIMFANFRKKEESDSLTSYYYSYSNSPEENGVYLFKISAFDIGNREVRTEEIKIGISEVPEFKLNQNSPNPFNPTTLISYKILVPTNVKLHVFNLTGKYVDILVDGFQTPGNYSVEFNTSKYSELSSGIYFYKLETNYTSDIKKMIFTK